MTRALLFSAILVSLGAVASVHAHPRQLSGYSVTSLPAQPGDYSVTPLPAQPGDYSCCKQHDLRPSPSLPAQPAEPLSSHGYAPAPPPIEALQPPMPETQRLGTVRPVDLLFSSPERLASARPGRLASLDRSFARALESYVAEAPLRRTRLSLLDGRDRGRRAPVSGGSAQESDTGPRLYLLIGAAVLVAGWVSYAVFASGEDDGVPPDPPPRPQPQQ